MKFLSLFIFSAFFLDQFSKYFVIYVLNVSPVNPIDVFPPFLRLRYGENTGINFGLFGNSINVWVLIGIALVVCFAVLYWLQKHPQPRIAQASAGVLIGGALANVFDRIIYGYVLDFLNMSCCGINNPFVFNVADIFIFLGAFGLIIFGYDPKVSKKGA